jgi:hypothetical protein
MEDQVHDDLYHSALEFYSGGSGDERYRNRWRRRNDCQRDTGQRAGIVLHWLEEKLIAMANIKWRIRNGCVILYTLMVSFS